MVKLDVEVKKALFVSLKALGPERGRQLGSYRQRAFPGDDTIEHLLAELKGETHKVLVWHVATCLCQIDLLEKAGQSARLYREPGQPFLPRGSDQADDATAPQRPPHYVTAVSQSNYCAYLVTQMLVPDNGLVTSKVFEAVCDEAREALLGHDTKIKIYNALILPAKQRVSSGANNRSASIVDIGAELAVRLGSKYSEDSGDAELWLRLGNFWTGYLLYLSAWTRAAKHQIHLQGRGELTTHLWALLSHAGFLGPVHGHQLLDPIDEDGQYAFCV